MIFTIDRLNAILRAEGMPKCEDFTRSIPGISREAQACGALERKYRMPGLDLEHLRFWMKDGQRVKMLLGERVDCLEAHAELNPRYVARVGEVFVERGEVETLLVENGIDVKMIYAGGEVQVDRFETNKGEFVDMPYFGSRKE